MFSDPFLHSVMVVKWGILLFAGVVFFQILTLPVEINASRRILAALRNSGLVTEYGIGGSRNILTSAAIIYVAAAAAAILQLLYFFFAGWFFAGRDER